MPGREFLNMVEALMREDVYALHAGDGQALSEALDDLDDFLADDDEAGVVGLHDPARDAAWAELGGG